MMHLIFQRKVVNESKVETKVTLVEEGKTFDVGMVRFPTKQTWTKFIGALQRGAMQVPELEITLENVSTPSTSTPPLTATQIIAQGGAKPNEAK